MSHIINYEKYRNCVRRKVPSIIYYEDNFDDSNLAVIKIMDEMRKTYPLVFCYQVNWLQRGIADIYNTVKTNSEVVCFRKGVQKYILSVYSTEELHNLFKTVYNDCVCNFLAAYNRMLFRNKLVNLSYVHELFEIKNPSYEILIEGKCFEQIAKSTCCIRNKASQNYDSSISDFIYDISSKIKYFEDFNDINNMSGPDPLNKFTSCQYQELETRKDFSFSTPSYNENYQTQNTNYQDFLSFNSLKKDINQTNPTCVKSLNRMKYFTDSSDCIQNINNLKSNYYEASLKISDPREQPNNQFKIYTPLQHSPSPTIRKENQTYAITSENYLVNSFTTSQISETPSTSYSSLLHNSSQDFN